MYLNDSDGELCAKVFMRPPCWCRGSAKPDMLDSSCAFTRLGRSSKVLTCWQHNSWSLLSHRQGKDLSAFGFDERNEKEIEMK